VNTTTTKVPVGYPAVRCEVCRDRPGWLRVRVDRVATGPGVASVCGPCGMALRVERCGVPVEAAR
jgi:hypothetical protein